MLRIEGLTFDFAIEVRIRKRSDRSYSMIRWSRRGDRPGRMGSLENQESVLRASVLRASVLRASVLRASVLRAMASTTYSTSEERLLLREITHRVNNEFASAIQVVSVAAARSGDRNVKAALTGVMEQLHDYARVHHALQMPANNDCIDASAYLRELAAQSAAPNCRAGTSSSCWWNARSRYLPNAAG